MNNSKCGWAAFCIANHCIECNIDDPCIPGTFANTGELLSPTGEYKPLLPHQYTIRGVVGRRTGTAFTCYRCTNSGTKCELYVGDDSAIFSDTKKPPCPRGFTPAWATCSP